MESNKKKTLKVAGLFTAFGILSKILLLNVPNVSGLESLALFGGAYFLLRKFAFIIPLVALIVSDFFINNVIYRSYFPNTEGLILFESYIFYAIASLCLIVLFANYFMKEINFKTGTLGVLGSTLIFWTITNLGSFLGALSPYPMNFAGLVACYEAALPFLKYSLAGNAIFTVILFGSYEYVKTNHPSLIPVKVKN